jgi:hypothetical protein
VNISKFVIYARIQISVIKTLEPEKLTEGKEQINEESETMTKSKKMNANYEEHDSKNKNKGGFFPLCITLVLDLANAQFCISFLLCYG